MLRRVKSLETLVREGLDHLLTPKQKEQVEKMVNVEPFNHYFYIEVDTKNIWPEKMLEK